MDLQTTPPGCVPVPITTGISHVTFIGEAGTLTGEHVGIDICDTSFFRGFVCFYHVAVYFSPLRIDLVVQFDTSGARVMRLPRRTLAYSHAL